MTCAKMPSMKCWHAHQWRLWENVGFFFKEDNKLTYKSLFIKLHSQRTNIVSGFLIQSMIRNEYHIYFVSTDPLKTNTQISFDFLLEHVEIVSSTNQGVLLCHAHNKSSYYVCIPSIKQWQKILNLKTQYDWLVLKSAFLSRFYIIILHLKYQ